ncbi:MAG: hypothetical protein RXR02_07900 [Thermoproteus sp.]
MRIPLPILAAALVVIAAGVVMLNVAVPAKPASVLINASALQPGQNMTLHLNYVPLNITVIPANNSNLATVVCMYYHGTLIDSGGYPWVNVYEITVSGNTYTATFTSAADFKDSNMTIFVTLAGAGYTCPPNVG